ncbi:MAG: HAD-IB family hydrolase [bacterium]|nr:HAD-IB family hydrolase [bacterium]
MTSTTPSGHRAAAFFDLDKTVIAKSSTLAFVRPLHTAGLLKHRTLLKAAVAQAVYRTIGADQLQLDRVRDQLIRLTKGWKADRIRRLVQETVDEVISPVVYAEALALIEQHRREGREIVIVSVSPEEVVRPLAGYLGVDNVIATRSAVDNEGRYTGSLAFYASGPGKAEAICSMARERDLDLEQCFAYSDSHADLPMLELVGHPVAVNPDRVLKQTAIERGWPRVEFDKPVTLRSRMATLQRPAPIISGTALATAVVGAIALWALKARQKAA